MRVILHGMTIPKTKSPEERINLALKSFDWLKCYEALEEIKKNPSKNPVAILIERINYTGQLIEHRKNSSLAEAKEKFKFESLEYIQKWGTPEELDAYKDHLAGCLLVEECFAGILESTSKLHIQSLSLNTQVWSFLEWLDRSYITISEAFKNDLKSPNKLFDPISHQIELDGIRFSPDSVIPNIIDSVSSTMFMYGYNHNLFNSNGVLVIPERTLVTEESTLSAEELMLFGLAWNTLEMSDQRWRFFGGTIAKEVINLKLEDGSIHQFPSMHFKFADADDKIQLLDMISNERLNRLIGQVHTDEHTVENIINIKNKPALPPEAFVSQHEYRTLVTLSMILCFDIFKDKTLYAGLTLIQWVRCFSWLREYSQEVTNDVHDNDVNILLITTEQIEEGLLSVGVEKIFVEKFLKCAVFNKKSDDLFDSPLIQCNDNRYALFPRFIKITSLVKSLLSMLSSHKVTFEKKGDGLEESVITLLKQNKIECKGFAYKVNGEEFEYDVVAVWDKKVFVFECKNRSVSNSKHSKRYSVLKDTIDAIEQLERLIKALHDNPKFLNEQFGILPPYEIVPCVLNGHPFSIPDAINLGAYVYDFSALSKFFDDGTIILKVPMKLPNKVTVVTRRHVARVWAGNSPRADDLIKQFENHWQITSLMANYVFEYNYFHIKEDLYGWVAFPRKNPPNLERTLKSIGVLNVKDELAYFDSLSSQYKILKNKFIKADEKKSSRKKKKEKTMNKRKRKILKKIKINNKRS